MERTYPDETLRAYDLRLLSFRKSGKAFSKDLTYGIKGRQRTDNGPDCTSSSAADAGLRGAISVE
jgi:hypothetical protein